MKITWQINVGRFITEIDDDELSECDDWNREEFIREHIQRAVDHEISWTEIKREG